MSWRKGKRPNQAVWRRARRRALERDNYQCQYPGCARRYRLEVHHRRPLDAGGDAYALDNLLTLCRHHHILVEQQLRPTKRPKGILSEWAQRCEYAR